MADEDKSQQTEEPTAKRLQQAQEQGDVVKSQEVTAFVLLAGGTLALAMFGKYTAMSLARTLTAPAPSLDHLCDTVLASLGTRARDDIALLLARPTTETAR